MSHPTANYVGATAGGKRAAREHLAAQVAEPTVAIAEPDAGPIERAFRGAAMALDGIEHQLGDLNGVLERLAYNLSPVLTDGTYSEPPTALLADDQPVPEDRRSTIARRLTALEDRANRLADIVTFLSGKLGAVDAAVELEGVAR